MTSLAPSTSSQTRKFVTGLPLARLVGVIFGGWRRELRTLPPGLSRGMLRQKVRPSRTSATPCSTFCGVSRLRRPRSSSGPKSPQVEPSGRRVQRGFIGCPPSRAVSRGVESGSPGRMVAARGGNGRTVTLRGCPLTACGDRRDPRQAGRADGRRGATRRPSPYCIVGASFLTLCTSSPSHAAFLAVPSKVALVLKSSYLPSRA